ncbi:high-potential iron-sulfur protein [Halosolutus amylolyticus]|uniref:High-potential iron-sulfur protein n=1 Tax=Halosolutus amylolyticus TaxID=2932267 RepID=A0ABD5PLV0_9EURY|nr:high-potential iron-sulfur protein [Halosolutus amylolyticus]
MWSRRHYLVATVGISALSGCIGDTEQDETDTENDDEVEEDDDEDEAEAEERPEGVSEEEFARGPVPDVYLSATSLGGEERDPDALQSKADVDFSEYEEAEENEAHRAGTCCANCDEFVPDRNGDEFGACVAVEGYIDGADWCTIWEELPEPEVPDGLSESDLATAEVPEEYRAASSQTGEERDPDDLLTQEEVSLMESVDAIAEETAPPGQSCGNCAEFIPDENGDGWGACARVEGYVAVEDWCSVWEHVSEEL